MKTWTVLYRLALAAVPVVILAAAAAAQGNAGASCPANAQGIQQETDCTCTAADLQAPRTVWGTDIYTDDSHVCTAARHAGVVGANGGAVRVTPRAGLQAYGGSSRNGVTTQNYGPWQRAFTVAAPGGKAAEAPAADPNMCPANFQAFRGRNQSLACNCTAAQVAQGTVWGTDVYTDDSSICRAALHAGVVPAAGGPVRLQSAPARQSYPGSTRNGVTTQQFGPWAGAFSFAK